MHLILIFNIGKQIRDVHGKFQIDLGFGTLGHQVHHNAVQPVKIPDPASILSVTEFTF